MAEAGDDQPTVVVVEDHGALVRGLQVLLRAAGLKVIGAAPTEEAGFEMIRRLDPDVAIVDIGLASGNGIQLTRRLLAEDPSRGVLLYTGLGDEEVLREGLDCGALGFALKAGSADELMQAVKRVAAGETYVDPRLRPLLLSRTTTERIAVLTPREREVLDLLAQGLNGTQVAERLFISPATVRTHVENAMEKLEARTRVHAVALALRQGEIGD
jgi:DNA-binding NarL/FixJ family response regulator